MPRVRTEGDKVQGQGVCCGAQAAPPGLLPYRRRSRSAARTGGAGGGAGGRRGRLGRARGRVLLKERGVPEPRDAGRSYGGVRVVWMPKSIFGVVSIRVGINGSDLARSEIPEI